MAANLGESKQEHNRLEECECASRSVSKKILVCRNNPTWPNHRTSITKGISKKREQGKARRKSTPFRVPPCLMMLLPENRNFTVRFRELRLCRPHPLLPYIRSGSHFFCGLCSFSFCSRVFKRVWAQGSGIRQASSGPTSSLVAVSLISSK